MIAEKTFKHHGITIEIHHDEDARSPQEDGDNGLFLVGLHRDFFVRPPDYKAKDTWNGDALKAEIDARAKTHWIFPLEAYIHGGVALAFGSEGNFPDRRWDVSQLGCIFVAKSEWRLQKKARAAAAGLIETWNQYLSGDVWGYVVDPDGEHDSCWGFYGLDYCEQQAREMAEHIAATLHRARLERVKAFIKKHVPLEIRARELATA